MNFVTPTHQLLYMYPKILISINCIIKALSPNMVCCMAFQKRLYDICGGQWEFSIYIYIYIWRSIVACSLATKEPKNTNGSGPFAAPWVEML